MNEEMETKSTTANPMKKLNTWMWSKHHAEGTSFLEAKCAQQQKSKYLLH